ncbi:MAG TPA: FadR/GntR family transcriptional regulator [Gaiellaceae bacterium]|jgi:DNA-binding FadR family transcriptional regulator|nr:FadR/GntR family transcriptional regulator [Gaiellaceae bacterium]
MTSRKVATSTHGGPLTSIVRTHRSAQVREQIQEAITRGDFQPGERLPSERELVETFGVSRVSVREAIRSLEALGVVSVQQGRGAFVNDRRSGLAEPLARWLAMHRDELFDLHRVRGALDELAAQCAAEQHDPDGVESLVAAHNVLREQVEAGAPADELMRLDLDFHMALAEASGNRLLYDLLFDLHTLLAEARRFSYVTAGRPPISVAEHGKIAEAVERGDPIAARAAMREHVDSIRKVTMTRIAQEQPDNS